MEKYLIKSVLGFNLKADIIDKDGKIVPSGSICSCRGTFSERSCNKMIDRTFFTSFNQDLLNKFIEYRRIND
jgi:hypothetical protein